MVSGEDVCVVSKEDVYVLTGVWGGCLCIDRCLGMISVWCLRRMSVLTGVWGGCLSLGRMSVWCLRRMSVCWPVSGEDV